MVNNISPIKKFLVLGLFVVLTQAKIASAGSDASTDKSVEPVLSLMSFIPMASSKLNRDDLQSGNNYPDLCETILSPLVLGQHASLNVFLRITDQIREAHPEAETMLVMRAGNQAAVLPHSAKTENLAISKAGRKVTKVGFYPDINKSNKFRVLDAPIAEATLANKELLAGRILDARSHLDNIYTVGEALSVRVFGPEGDGSVLPL